MLNELTLPEIRTFQEALLDFALKKNPDLLKLIREKRKLDPEIEKAITQLVGDFVGGIINQRPKDTSVDLDDYEHTALPAEFTAAPKK